MKVVILAGGFGTRISEESQFRPKPMIEIGGKPILWHIMKIYSHYGFNDFIICCGYKGYFIKEYFANYFLHESDVTFDFRGNNQNVIIHEKHAESWTVTLIDTGLETATGGRIAKVINYIGNETFMMTYGDGVSDINVAELLKFHRKQGKKATVTAILPAGRWGALNLNENFDTVIGFQEKPIGDGMYISGGFFVFEPAIFDYIEGVNTPLESAPLENLTKEGQLAAYRHLGFWQSMDTLRDKVLLEKLWSEGNAPWKLWA